MKSKRFVIAILCVFLIFVIGFIWNLNIPDWQKLDIDRIYNLTLSTVVYDSQNTKMAVLSGHVDRHYVRLQNMPPYVSGAFVAAEDARFYSHNGIDIRRIFGALISNVKSGSYEQGASTITQQLIKLTHLNSEKTLSRKAQEAWLAIQLERKLSKDEILEAYVNTVYFGGGAYGIAAASQRYFSKEPAELSISEAATLAGIIKSPNNYAPHNNMAAAKRRRDYVLEAMLENGDITKSEYDEAQASDILLNETKSQDASYGWYTDMVMNEACEIIGINAEELLGGGYSIYTGMDKKMQLTAEEIMADMNTYPEEAAQGAMVVIDPANSEIRAIVGGRRYETRFGLNRAYSAYRQPGSLIKPLSTYAAAVEKHGFIPTSKVFDVQKEYAGGYMPGNAGGAYYEETNVRTALAKSLNAATVELADTLGINEVAEICAGFGIPITDLDRNLALALGSMTYGTTPLQMCNAYAVLANGGCYNTPYFIRRIEDRYGNTIYENISEKRRVISVESAYILTDMLQTAATEGTASALCELGIPIAAKTGTAGLKNSDTSDAWATAYTPDIVVTVWIGKDDNSDGGMAKGVSGSGYAIPACKRFLQDCLPDLSGKKFEMPEGLTAALIDGYALAIENRIVLASAGTPEQYVRREIFRDAPGLEISDIWEAPEAVTDLTLVSERGKIPVLQFTCNSKYAEYEIVRRCNGVAEQAGIVKGDYGTLVRFADTDANTALENVYSVIPRHALLTEIGIEINGPESIRISAYPAGLLNQISGYFSHDENKQDVVSSEDPIF